MTLSFIRLFALLRIVCSYNMIFLNNGLKNDLSPSVKSYMLVTATTSIPYMVLYCTSTFTRHRNSHGLAKVPDFNANKADHIFSLISKVFECKDSDIILKL